MSLNAAEAGVAICVKLAQPAPAQRSTLYPVTPTLSVEAVHVRLIDVAKIAVAVKFAGAVGGVVSCIDGGAPKLAHPPSSNAPHTATRAP